MRNALILHGKPTRERYENPNEPKPHEANWLPWLGSELAKRGITTAIPALPRPYSPDYDAWRDVFEQHAVNQDTGIVGHSAGAEFILRWLSENPHTSIDRLLLIAPYHDTKRKYGEFSEYDLDLDLQKRMGRITIFNSLDDDTGIQSRVHMLREALPSVRYIEFKDYGHFRLGHNMTSTEFPEALDELLMDT